jgi:hypothetical protein
MIGAAIAALEHLAVWLRQNDIGLAVFFLVGLSMSLSHVFALLANRLTPRQIATQLLLDALVLTVAILLNLLLNTVLLAAVTGLSVPASGLVDALAPALLPGLLYGFVAAPYISDLIALTLWGLIHLNTIALLHASFAISCEQALLLSTPGFVVAMLLVWLLFRQSWRSAYRRLATQLTPL